MMQKQQMWPAFLIVLGVLLSRLVPHPVNFAPVVATSLFAATHISRRSLGLLGLLGGMLASDFVLGLHPYMFFTYGSLGLIYALGAWIRPQSFARWAGSTFAGSLIFYFVTNSGYWLLSGLYPRNAQGLLQCLVAALPFFPQQMLGDFVYIALLLGSLYFVRNAVAFLGGTRYKSAP